jgi:hypothetical protein
MTTGTDIAALYREFTRALTERGKRRGTGSAWPTRESVRGRKTASPVRGAPILRGGRKRI